MKLLSPIVGLLLVCLLLTATEADISLTLRNKQYLPPPIQEVSGNTPQQTFKENKYGNSRYQIFEVHNHYEPSSTNGGNEQKAPVNRGYLPPQEEEIHIQHVNAPADFPFDDPNLDDSYLNFASGSDSNNQQIIVKHETRIVAANNKPSIHVQSNHIQSNNIQSNNIPSRIVPSHHAPVPFPSNYQPKQNVQSSRKPVNPRQNHQGHQQQQQQVLNNFNTQKQTQQFSQQHVQHIFTGQQQSIPKSNTIKGKQYLPPAPTQLVTGRRPLQNVVQNTFKGPEYLPPRTGNNPQQSSPVKQNTGFKGPEIAVPHQQGVTHQKQASFQQNTGFKGPEISTPHQQSVPQQKNSPFKGPEYLPPHQQSFARQQHTSALGNSHIKGPDYLPPHHDVSVLQQQTSFQQNSPFNGPDYLPPHQQSFARQQQTSVQQNSALKDPEYLPPHQDGPVQQQPQQASFQQSSPFKGPEYLPPHQNQVPQQQTKYQEANPTFKASQYLPPGYDFQKPDNFEQAIAELHTLPEQSPQYQQEVTVGTQIQVAGPEQPSDIVYGTPKQANPPNGNEQSQQQQPQQEYLPPGYDFQKPKNSEQALQKLHSQEASEPRQIQISTTFEDNEFLPPGYIAPKPENSEQAINQLHSLNDDEQQPTNNEQSAGYLPPGYEFQKPAEVDQPITHNYQTQIHQNTHQNSENQQQVHSYNQADPQQQQSYTQPTVSQQSQSYQMQQSLIQISQQSQSFQTQGSQQQTYSQSLQEVEPITQSFKGSDYLPPVAAVSSQPILEHITQPSIPPFSNQALPQPQFKAPAYLPPATSSQPQLQQITQPSVQPFEGADYLPPISSSPNNQAPQQAPRFKAPDYLPPVTSSQPQLQQVSQPSIQPLKGPDYLPPQNPPQVSSSVNYRAPQQVPQFKAPDYLPPTAATPTQHIQPTIMYPLSSYMTNVQPHERYGNARKPFPEYGPPPTTAATVFSNNDVSPMYREPATMPPYYAPTMSYPNNAINTQTYTTYNQHLRQQTSSAFDQQTRQTLQTFMPKDIRQEITHNHITASHTLGAKTPLQTSKRATAKIRTVQIVNQANVKTLKVLESLDHAGVKTIKILGHSNEQPTGDHRIVKVVSGHGQTEQTVKIFNDQQDVNTAVDQSSQSNSNNDYLPPRHKRNHKHASSTKGRRRI